MDRNEKVLYVMEQYFSVDKLLFYSLSDKTSKEPPANDLTDQQSPTASLVQFKSKEMQNVYKLADHMAPKNINILILGNSGTGKSQLAERIHNNSARKNGPFITINCSTIPPNLIESELFGYKKGAFSGANAVGKKGLVELADNGTLFLDEIGELPLSLQSKLLQLAQEKTYLPVGDVETKHLDARIIAATNQNIPKLISEGKFREDLFYRLAVVTINIPALHGRCEDIKQLINYFSNRFNLKHNSNVIFSNSTIKMLCQYSWPGNIRELEHLTEFLILNSSDEYVTPELLPKNIYSESALHTSLETNAAQTEEIEDTDFSIANETLLSLSDVTTLQEFHDTLEQQLIQSLYKKFNTSYKMAMRLGISQSKANRLLNKYIKKKS